MKAVLISIQPKWCNKIANGEKTIEVRKTKPNLETPFKVYIYCTKAKEMHHNGCIVWYEDSLFSTDKGEIKYGSSLELWGNNYEHGVILNGKVIGEFVCDRIAGEGEIIRGNACLTEEELQDYCNGKDIYFWRISALKIYDKPKELSEFHTICDKIMSCSCCKYHIYECNESGATEFCGCDGQKPIERPPQSWCYVERKE